jgi:hypothetical protein
MIFDSDRSLPDAPKDENTFIKRRPPAKKMYPLTPPQGFFYDSLARLTGVCIVRTVSDTIEHVSNNYPGNDRYCTIKKP